MKSAIPKVTSTNAAERKLLEAIKEAIEIGDGVTGNPLDRKLTVRDLVDSGMATLSVNNTASYIKPTSIKPEYPDPVIVDESGNPIDLTTPNAPENLIAFKGVASVFLTWDKADFSNYGHTNIYRATTDNFANAVVISNVLGTTYADYVPIEVLDEETGDIRGYYYWITFTSEEGIESAPNATSGTYQEPTKNGDDAIFQLSVNLLVGDTANFVTANINDASISSAKIAQIIQSDDYDADNGWMINKDGFMIINNIYARGVIEGSRIIGSVIEGGIIIGDAEFALPTEYDTGAAPRYLCYGSNVAFSGSTTQGLSMHGSSPSYRSIEIDMKSSSYTGEGTESYDGYTIYSNLNRYYPNIVKPSISISSLSSMNNEFTGNTLGNKIRFTVQIKTLIGSTVVRTDTFNTGWYWATDSSLSGGGITTPVASGPFIGSLHFRTAAKSSTSSTKSPKEYSANFSCSGISYSGDDALSFQIKAYITNLEYSWYIYGHTATVTDSNSKYL